jgi:hypothetical protein
MWFSLLSSLGTRGYRWDILLVTKFTYIELNIYFVDQTSQASE